MGNLELEVTFDEFNKNNVLQHTESFAVIVKLHPFQAAPQQSGYVAVPFL